MITCHPLPLRLFCVIECSFSMSGYVLSIILFYLGTRENESWFFDVSNDVFVLP